MSLRSSLSLFLALQLGFLCGNAASTAELHGEVVGLVDGDTVTVLDATKTQYRIRLTGIDAPEKHQSFGARSRNSLSDMVFRKTVKVEFQKKDRYGRIVGKVIIGSLDASLEQVRRGMAWHYKAFEQEQSQSDRLLYTQAEEDARKAHRGLWRERDPIAPWDFRRMR